MKCETMINTKPTLRQGDGQLSATVANAELLRLVAYLSALGHKVGSGRDVYEAIRSLPDEEELGAEQRSDDVVVTHASDGWQMLVSLGELSLPHVDVASDASRQGDAC